MTHDYIIAGHRIRLTGRGAGLESLPAFDAFRTEAEGEAVMVFRTDAETWQLGEAAGATAPLCEAGNDGLRSRFCAGDSHIALHLSRRNGPEAVWIHRRGTAEFLCDAAAGGPADPALLRFMLWMAYGVAAAPLATVAIHSSAVVAGGRAVLFLGESGTGKSTHTRLWCRHIPGAELLNDDSPLVRVGADGSVAVHGSPWSGKTPCHRSDSYPLAGIVRLSQAPHNRIVRLGTLAALGALQPSCPPELNYDEALADAIYSTLGGILRTTPVWHLECLPDREAALLSFSTVLKGL